MRLIANNDSVAVRMVRIGHGDCFLLAFPRDSGGGDPVYVLIDCGYKPSSPNFIHKNADGSFENGPTPDEIVQHLHDATGGTIDLCVITHEHQDHVNAIFRTRDDGFPRLTIKKAWLAWTEDGSDADANALRRRHRDTLFQVAKAARQLRLSPHADPARSARLDEHVALAWGATPSQDSEPAEALGRAFGADNVKGWTNKEAIRTVRRMAEGNDGVRFLEPGDVEFVPNTDVRAYVLGPPRDLGLLFDEDPVGAEEFHLHGVDDLAYATAGSGGATGSPFAAEYRVDTAAPSETAAALLARYQTKGAEIAPQNWHEVEGPQSWRRIDTAHLADAEALAIRMNSGINNSSLVLAFELPASKKVLLFVGDAQRGNWLSWDDQTWSIDGESVDARDLLRRTVLYKVGHHGSHNATLNGERDAEYPCLGWMGLDEYASEFCAMIPAVWDWAKTQKNWIHPMPAIEAALNEKAPGRVIRTDYGLTGEPTDAFRERVAIHDLFVDVRIADEKPASAFAPRLRFVRVLANPDANQDETVWIHNDGDEDIALGGWKVIDEASTHWLLDANEVVPSGGEVALVRGGRRMRLNNGGDEIRLVDPHGRELDRWRFGRSQRGVPQTR